VNPLLRKLQKEIIMQKSNLAVTAAITGLMALGASALTATPAAAAETEMEKCYGVVKAGQNDCATKANSCAGTVKEDAKKDAFIVVPKGLCDRLAGGSKTSS
jgi:uncharacterized membrane protein